jgi:hypothetical protein
MLGEFHIFSTVFCENENRKELTEHERTRTLVASKRVVETAAKAA